MENEKKPKATVTPIRETHVTQGEGEKESTHHANDKSVTGQSSEKMKQVVGQIDWNYETLYEDINGFIESHEKSVKKLEKAEADKIRFQSELTRTQRQLNQLNKSIKEKEEKLSKSETTHKSRLNYLTQVKNDLEKKYKMTDEKKRQQDKAVKRLGENLKVKEDELNSALQQLTQVKQRFSSLNQSFSEKLESFKRRYREKVDVNERVAIEKAQKITQERDQLHLQMNELMTDFSKNNDELVTLRKRVSELQESRQGLLKSKDEMTRQIEDLHHENENLVKKAEEFQTEEDHFALKMRERGEAIERLRKKVSIYEEQKQATDKRLDQYEAEIKKLTTTIQNKELQIDESYREISRLKVSKKEHDNLLQRLQDQEVRENQLVLELKKVRDDLTSSGTKVKELKGLIDQYKDQVEKQTESERDLLRSIEEKTKLVDTEKSRVEKAQIEASHQQKQLKNELERLLKTIQVKDSEIASLNEATVGLNKKIEILDAEKDQFRESISQLKAQNERIHHKLMSSNEDLDRLNGDLEKSEETIKELRSHLTTNTTKYSELKNEYDGLKSSSVDFEETIARKESMIADARAQYDELTIRYKELVEQNRIVNLSKSDFEKKMSTRDDKIDHLNDEVATHQRLNAEMQKDLERFKGQTEALKAYLEQAKEKAETSKNALAEKTSRVNELSVEVESLTRTKAELETKVIESEARYKDEISELDRRFEEKLKSYEHRFEQITIENKEISSRYDVIRTEKENLERQKIISEKNLEASQESLESFRNEVYEKQRKIDELLILEKENVQLKTDIKKNEADFRQQVMKRNFEINTLKSKLQEAESNTIAFTEEKRSLEFQIDELNQQIEEHSSREEVLSTEISESLENVDRLENKIMALEDEKQSLRDEVKTLEVELSSERDRIEKFRRELQNERDENLSRKLQETEFTEREQEWSDTKELFESKIADLKLEIASRDEEIEKKQRLIDDGINERKRWMTQSEDLKQKLMDLQQSYDEARQELKDFDEKSESFKEEIRVLKEQITQKDNAIETLKDRFEQKSANFESNKKQLEDKVNWLKSELAKKEKQFSIEVESKNKTIESIKREQDKIATVAKERQDRIANYETKEMEYIKLLEKRESQVEQERQSRMEFQENFRVIEERDGKLQAEIAQLTDDKKTLSHQLERVTQELDVTKVSMTDGQKKFSSLIEEKRRLEEKIDTDTKMIEEVKLLQQENEQLKEEMEEREDQLNHYSRWVDSQKEGLQKHVLRLAQEIKTSTAMNPMRAYLKMTEKEITKVEIAMGKTQAFGAQRAQLEEQFEALIKQRDEIKELLEHSQAEAEKQAKKVMNFLKSSEFVPVPPLPPTES
jgi:chromosome segregation ATPase